MKKGYKENSQKKKLQRQKQLLKNKFFLKGLSINGPCN